MMPGPFTPTSQNTRILRDAFGTFATGVTIVTTQTADGPLAITVNSFSSLSLDPPLIMWAIEHTSNRFDAFNGAKHFAVHILKQEQKELALACARDGAELRKLDYTLSGQNTPILPEYLSVFECASYDSITAGDHNILVGRVISAQQNTGEPLIFFGGEFSGLSAS
jgi:flavin reductase (DIM6/NTAB) family NADH-FMN oxidoreductase RutF